jgi:putative ABC transport system permease protein
VLSGEAAVRHQLRPTPIVGIYFDTEATPSEAAEDRARALLDPGDGSGVFEVERGPQGERLLRQVLLIVALALGMTTLMIVIATVALSTAEMRNDLATFAAVGAPPRVRRRLSAAHAMVLTMTGSGLGLVLGTICAVMLALAQRVPLSPLPWQYVVPAALGAALVGAASGYFASPRRVPLTRRAE